MESVTREIVGQEAPRPTTAAANNAPQSRYCSNCGHQLAEDDRFCANCGTPVDEAAHEPPPEADWWRIPPAAERNALERLLFGTGTADTTPPQLNLPADATEQVTNLKDDIANLNLPAGTNTSLSATLQQAQGSIDADNISAALGQLDAFINQVKALDQRGKLSSQKAADLISSAEQIKVVLGG